MYIMHNDSNANKRSMLDDAAELVDRYRTCDAIAAGWLAVCVSRIFIVRGGSLLFSRPAIR